MPMLFGTSDALITIANEGTTGPFAFICAACIRMAIHVDIPLTEPIHFSSRHVHDPIGSLRLAPEDIPVDMLLLQSHDPAW